MRCGVRRQTLACLSAVAAAALLCGCASEPQSCKARCIVIDAQVAVAVHDDESTDGFVRVSESHRTRPHLKLQEGSDWIAKPLDDGEQFVISYSGGGSYGAYGIGVTDSLLARISPNRVRVVCGVSAGSLIALEVFAAPTDGSGKHPDDEYLKQLDPNWATTLKDCSCQDIRVSGLSYLKYIYVCQQQSALLGETASAGMQTKTIDAYLQERVSNLLPRLAAAHESGKRLYIGTTDLTAGQYVIWNAGLIASKAHKLPSGPDKVAATRYLADIVRASCSAPSLLYPVALPVYGKVDHQFGDGGIGYNFIPSSELIKPLTCKPTKVLAIRNGYRSVATSTKPMNDDLAWLLNYVRRSTEIWIATTEQTGLDSFISGLPQTNVEAYEFFVPASVDVRANMSSLEWGAGRSVLYCEGVEVGRRFTDSHVTAAPK